MSEPLKPEHAAVLKYLDMMQSIITRLASNSSSCKQWCISLVTAIVALSYKLGPSGADRYVAVLALLPVLLFFFLDSYYLGLERRMRDQFGSVARQLRAGGLPAHALYVFPGRQTFPQQLSTTLRSMGSGAILPFYLFLSLLVAAAQLLLMPDNW